MPRSREFEPKEALQKAMQVIWRQGYTATSIEDLVEHTGVSRYGLYTTFGDKRELFLAVLDCYRDTVVSRLLGALERPEAGLPEIRHYFQFLIDTADTQTGRLGCLMCNTAVELAPFDSEIAEKVQEYLNRIKQAFTTALHAAKRQGELGPDFDCEGSADYLLGLTQGLFVLTRSPAPRETIQHFIESALSRLA